MIIYKKQNIREKDRGAFFISIFTENVGFNDVDGKEKMPKDFLPHRDLSWLYGE
ncbi:MAG TPA: hypothetical protein GXX20_10065 [Clostridiaceae bacterium]|nr:hypothetical protein [Clostridiaceae bacterium]